MIKNVGKIIAYYVLLLAALLVMAVIMPFVIIGVAIIALFYGALILLDKTIDRLKLKKKD